MSDLVVAHRHDERGVTEASLERVREYRRAARLAVRADDHSPRDRYLAFIELAEAARAEPDPLVRAWAERAMWEEAKSLLAVDDEQHEYPPERYERAQRGLRIEGYAICPACLSTLATEVDFERWRRMRRDHIRELLRREEAVL